MKIMLGNLDSLKNKAFITCILVHTNTHIREVYIKAY